MTIRLLYQSREARDLKYKELKAQGIITRRSTSRNQLIHPQYIEDFPNQAIKDDNGVGNSHYKTHFAVLYKLED